MKKNDNKFIIIIIKMEDDQKDKKDSHDLLNKNELIIPDDNYEYQGGLHKVQSSIVN